MKVGARTDVGRVRKINQDSFYISRHTEIPFFIVADGMGGHKAGEVASQMAVDLISYSIAQNIENLKEEEDILSLIKTSIEDANTKIYLKSHQDESYRGMGTTLIVACVHEHSLYIGHVGDSRAYLISNYIKQLTDDHSFVNQMVKTGNLSIEEAKNHPKKNLITRAVGSSSIIKIDLLRVDFEANDILLIMTDGVSNMLEDKYIYKVFKDSLDMEKSCQEIITAANSKGGMDNSTIVAVKFSNEVKI